MKRELKGKGFGNYYICYFYIVISGDGFDFLAGALFQCLPPFCFPFPSDRDFESFCFGCGWGSRDFCETVAYMSTRVLLRLRMNYVCPCGLRDVPFFTPWFKTFLIVPLIFRFFNVVRHFEGL